MANIITASRIFLSVLILFCPAFSIPFYTIYLLAGFTDMMDGTVARRMHSVSVFGSRLDTVADFVFVMACLVKLLPVMSIPIWLWIWIGIIAVIKIINIVAGFITRKELVAIHSIMNKITGFMLFLLPLTLRFMEFKYSAVVVCTVASFAAIQEGHSIRCGKYMGNTHPCDSNLQVDTLGTE